MDISNDWIYYSNGRDHFKLYKCKLDGSNKQKVANLPAYNISYYNGWIYFSTLNANTESEWETGGIYKIKENGTELTKLSDEITEKMYVSSKGIYYLTNGTRQNINRIGFGFYLVNMDVNGNNRRYINNKEKWINIKGIDYNKQASRTVGTLDVITDIVVYKNLIILTTANRILKLNLDNNKTEEIYKGKVDGAGNTGTLQIYYPYLYFSNNRELNQLNLTNNKVDKLGISIAASTKYVIDSDYVYYAVRERDGSILFKAKKENTRNAQIIAQFDPNGLTNIFHNIESLGDKLFFNALTFENHKWSPKPYLLDKNGDNLMMIN